MVAFLLSFIDPYMRPSKCLAMLLSSDPYTIVTTIVKLVMVHPPPCYIDHVKPKISTLPAIY